MDAPRPIPEGIVLLSINLTGPVRLKLLVGLAVLSALLWFNWRIEQVVFEDHPEVIPVAGKLRPLYQVRTRELWSLFSVCCGYT